MNNTINPYLMKTLKERFINQFEVISDDAGSFIRFPAKSSDFGDIIIYDEEVYPKRYMVEIGNLSHAHLDMSDEEVNESVKEVTGFLEKLFTDRLICYTNGCFDIDDYDSFNEVDCDLFVWSGKYKKSNITL